MCRSRRLEVHVRFYAHLLSHCTRREEDLHYHLVTRTNFWFLPSHCCCQYCDVLLMLLVVFHVAFYHNPWRWIGWAIFFKARQCSALFCTDTNTVTTLNDLYTPLELLKQKNTSVSGNAKCGNHLGESNVIYLFVEPSTPYFLFYLPTTLLPNLTLRSSNLFCHFDLLSPCIISISYLLVFPRISILSRISPLTQCLGYVASILPLGSLISLHPLDLVFSRISILSRISPLTQCLGYVCTSNATEVATSHYTFFVVLDLLLASLMLCVVLDYVLLFGIK